VFPSIQQLSLAHCESSHKTQDLGIEVFIMAYDHICLPNMRALRICSTCENRNGGSSHDLCTKGDTERELTRGALAQRDVSQEFDRFILAAAIPITRNTMPMAKPGESKNGQPTR